MDSSHIVTAFSAEERIRTLIRQLLGERRVSFLSGMTPDQRRETLRDADVLLSWSLAKELDGDEFPLLGRVRFIQLLSAGADHMPYRQFPPRILIASNVGAYAEPMAEHVVAMTLALAKNLFAKHRQMARGEFNQLGLNRLVRGSVCAILGFGGVGRASARLLRSLGVRIQALNTSGRTEDPVEFIGSLRDLDTVLPVSDIIVVSLPLTKDTRGLIGKRELEMMKPDAILINVARGEIIREEDLFAHLVAHPGFQAGIDTWWTEPFKEGMFRTRYPFFTLPNLLGSPHNSGMVPGMDEEGTRKAVENVLRFLRGEPVAGRVRREDYV